MNLDDNFTSVSGIIVEKRENCCILKSCRRSGKENTIWVWGLPGNLKIGTCVNAIGELQSRPIYKGSSKNVLGMKASIYFILEEECSEDFEAFNDFAFITGEIVWQSDLRLTTQQKSRIVELKILMKNGILIRIVAWNGLAEKVFRECRAGDQVEVEGVLCSRKYLKEFDGKMIEKITTEINAQKIRIA